MIILMILIIISDYNDVNDLQLFRIIAYFYGFFSLNKKINENIKALIKLNIIIVLNDMI